MQVQLHASLQEFYIFNALSWVHYVIQHEQPRWFRSDKNNSSSYSAPCQYLVMCLTCTSFTCWHKCRYALASLCNLWLKRWQVKKRAQHCVLLDADEKNYRYQAATLQRSTFTLHTVRRLYSILSTFVFMYVRMYIVFRLCYLTSINKGLTII